MTSPNKPRILMVDDEMDFLRLAAENLKSAGYETVCAGSAEEGLKAIEKGAPDLIFLDVMMSKMDGYEFCQRVRGRKETATVPIVFLTALRTAQDKAKAFAVGATDYLEKPVQAEDLCERIRRHLDTKSRWDKFENQPPAAAQPKAPANSLGTPSRFDEFKQFLRKKLDVSAEKWQQMQQVTKVSELYNLTGILGLPVNALAKFVAEWSGLRYFPSINPELIQLDLLPPPFCRQNLVVPLKDSSGKTIFVLANPFDEELVSSLTMRIRFEKGSLELAVIEPDAIRFLLGVQSHLSSDQSLPALNEQDASGLDDGEGQSTVQMSDNLISAAITHRASDIHVEPKESHYVVRLRVDGDMRELYTLKQDMGARLISRFKILGNMDIAERRKPQDGAFEMKIGSTNYKLRLASTSTPSGESLVVRILDQYMRPKALAELGMTPEQADTLMMLANQSRGLILVVGPTGSGKTTTIYSLLAQINCRSRSLTSVEDPVEYRIPFANQQQVNEKAGVTFESVLKSVVRQDPDILFVGEIRDPLSAKICVDFASTGHLTITTLHTSNATTAIFRLERLGTTRGAMADTLLGVVAQRLLKKLCSQCKQVVSPTAAELEMLAPYTPTPPAKVAQPVGCTQCNGTGYQGRVGVVEVFSCDTDIKGLIRTNRSVNEIREYVRDRNGYLVSHHAVSKVVALECAPRDVYEQILVEEPAISQNHKAEPASTTSVPVDQPQPAAPAQAPAKTEQPSILIVDDDSDTRLLTGKVLENRGYSVTLAEDGIGALLILGKRSFDLIISDVNMPNLDGFKLLEVMNQKGLQIPVLFLTGLSNQADELKGLDLGAVDYLTKPFEKDILAARVKRVIERGQQQSSKAR